MHRKKYINISVTFNYIPYIIRFREINNYQYKQTAVNKKLQITRDYKY